MSLFFILERPLKVCNLSNIHAVSSFVKPTSNNRVLLKGSRTNSITSFYLLSSYFLSFGSTIAILFMTVLKDIVL